MEYLSEAENEELKTFKSILENYKNHEYNQVSLQQWNLMRKIYYLLNSNLIEMQYFRLINVLPIRNCIKIPITDAEYAIITSNCKNILADIWTSSRVDRIMIVSGVFQWGVVFPYESSFNENLWYHKINEIEEMFNQRDYLLDHMMQINSLIRRGSDWNEDPIPPEYPADSSDVFGWCGDPSSP